MVDSLVRDIGRGSASTRNICQDLTGPFVFGLFDDDLSSKRTVIQEQESNRMLCVGHVVGWNVAEGIRCDMRVHAGQLMADAMASRGVLKQVEGQLSLRQS